MTKLEFGMSGDEVERHVDPHIPTQEKGVPTRKLFVCREVPHVGSPGTTHKTIGYIDEPIAFCPGLGCNEGTGKDPLRFRREGRLWVHDGCGLPTRVWWEGSFLDMLVTEGEQ